MRAIGTLQNEGDLAAFIRREADPDKARSLIRELQGRVVASDALIASAQAHIATLEARFPTTAPAISNPTRVVNTAYQPSLTLTVFVSVSVFIATANNGDSGFVRLQIQNSATPNTIVNQTLFTGRAGDRVDASMSGWVPPGWYYQMKTGNLVGVPTYGIGVTTETAF